MFTQKTKHKTHEKDKRTFSILDLSMACRSSMPPFLACMYVLYMLAFQTEKEERERVENGEKGRERTA